MLKTGPKVVVSSLVNRWPSAIGFSCSNTWPQASLGRWLWWVYKRVHWPLPPLSQECIDHIVKNGTRDCMVNPPSVIIQQEFNRLLKVQAQVSDENITELARQTLLPADEVKFWVEHLKGVKNRRKQGARKVATTRVINKGQRRLSIKTKKQAYKIGNTQNRQRRTE